MSERLYREACQRERLEQCEQLAKQLERLGWNNLSPHGKGVYNALQWAIGDADEPPYPIGDEDE